MKVIGIIPARLESNRLDRKLLLEETGKPLIQHVYERASLAKKLEDLYVATDSEQIAQKVQGFGGKVLKTGTCASGTDRLAQACMLDEIKDSNIQGVINIQGDEPEIEPETINLLVEELQTGLYPMVTAGVWEEDLKQIFEASVVKLVVNLEQCALYFSRSPLPYGQAESLSGFYRHLGIYGYSKEFLLEYTKLPQTPLEKLEKLEQLRVLENGKKIKVIIVEDDSYGIDTRADYERFLERFRRGLVS